MKSGKEKVLNIVGQTASGKTSLSLWLAAKFNGEIISADSRQVYRGMDIGSGKVTHEEMGAVAHHLIDVADPNEKYTVADFVRDGREAIAAITKHGALPIIAGGTFFYSDALLGKVSLPNVSPNEALRTMLAGKSHDELYSLLEEKDPRRAATIDRHNPARLIRALEIIDAVGAVPELVESAPLYDVLTLGIIIDKEQLHKNIHTRLNERFEQGMIDEVTSLHTQGVSWERLESFGLEYRRIAEYLQGEMTLEEMKDRLEIDIRQFAKRQMTWLKRDPTIVWVNPTVPKDREQIALLVQSFLYADNVIQ